MYLQVAKRRDLKCSHHKEEMATMWCEGGVGWSYGGNHLATDKMNQNVAQLELLQGSLSTISQSRWGWGDSGRMHLDRMAPRVVFLTKMHACPESILWKHQTSLHRGTIYAATGSQKCQCPEKQKTAPGLVRLDEIWKAGWRQNTRCGAGQGMEEEATSHHGTGPGDPGCVDTTTACILDSFTLVIGLWLQKRQSLYALKYFGIKGHKICNLLSNGSEKYYVQLIPRMMEVMLTAGEARWRIHSSLVLFL